MALTKNDTDHRPRNRRAFADTVRLVGRNPAAITLSTSDHAGTHDTDPAVHGIHIDCMAAPQVRACHSIIAVTIAKPPACAACHFSVPMRITSRWSAAVGACAVAARRINRCAATAGARWDNSVNWRWVEAVRRRAIGVNSIKRCATLRP